MQEHDQSLLCSSPPPPRTTLPEKWDGNSVLKASMLPLEFYIIIIIHAMVVVIVVFVLVIIILFTSSPTVATEQYVQESSALNIREGEFDWNSAESSGSPLGWPLKPCHLDCCSSLCRQSFPRTVTPVAIVQWGWQRLVPDLELPLFLLRQFPHQADWPVVLECRSYAAWRNFEYSESVR
jgi:hypothetical protein